MNYHTFPYSPEDFTALSDCRLCPRNCGVNRTMGELGYCKSDAGFHISSICIHKGEEPVISGKRVFAIFSFRVAIFNVCSVRTMRLVRIKAALWRSR
ncbi:MAG: hypothetical protein HC905_04205 [Bacteroidales bacterium]|nr:hypothetical protein [Bacteroidales bacterium]